MSSHQRKQRSTECKSCSALLSPSQLSHKLVFVRSTQRKLGPPPPSFLYSFWLFGLCLLLFLLPWCQKTSKSRPTMLLKLQDCRSAALVQLQLLQLLQRSDSAGWKQKCCTCAQTGRLQPKPPANWPPVLTPPVGFYPSEHVKAAVSACATYLLHPSW